MNLHGPEIEVGKIAAASHHSVIMGPAWTYLKAYIIRIIIIRVSHPSSDIVSALTKYEKYYPWKASSTKCAGSGLIPRVDTHEVLACKIASMKIYSGIVPQV